MEMNYKLVDDVLVIKVDGRIDTNNAADAEVKFFEIANANTFKKLTLDFEDFDYISSAGLRVILKLKKTYNNFSIENVKSEVYEIFEMTGFSDIMEIKKAYKQYSVEGLSIIGKGAKGTVYRYNNDTVIKVYNDLNSLSSIENERRLAKAAFVMGVPTAISYDVVKVDGLYGSVFELLESTTLSDLIKNNDDLSPYAKTYSDLLKTIHKNIVDEKEFKNVKEVPLGWINEIREKNILDEKILDKIEKMIKDVPDTNNLLHVDYHTNNVLMQKGEALLIDMDTLSRGHPVFELANICATYVTFGYIPNNLESFLGFNKEKALDFYDKFLHYYLDDYSEAKINRINNKVLLLAYVRLIRHSIRRIICPEAIEIAKQKIYELLEVVESLDY